MATFFGLTYQINGVGGAHADYHGDDGGDVDAAVPQLCGENLTRQEEGNKDKKTGVVIRGPLSRNVSDLKCTHFYLFKTTFTMR